MNVPVGSRRDDPVVERSAEKEKQETDSWNPLLEGCSARFQCRTAYRYEGGDHVIFVGEVLAFDHFERAPLLFHGGTYAKVLPRARREPGAGDEVESSFRKDYLGYLLHLAATQLHQPVRARCAELGLSDEDYTVLALLIARPEISAAEVMQQLSAAGSGLGAQPMDSLLARQLVELGSGERAAKFHLTEAGRHVAIEIFAAAKAAEAHAAVALTFDDAQLLKQLLKRVIRTTLN